MSWNFDALPDKEKQYYLDQAPWRGSIFACYTPEGIHDMDGKYCDRIRNLSNITSPALKEKAKEILTNDIKKNKHLHKVIKNNLFFNMALR